MINKTKVTLLAVGTILVGCSTVAPPRNDAVESIQQKCSVILSNDVAGDQRW